MSECTFAKTCSCQRDTVTPTGTEWSLKDYLGAVAVRTNIGRMNYKVKPGLYTIGKPDSNASVFVTSNYKLTFDHVRRALSGIDAWVLVLDTNGVNVWCAAGKGLFSTEELCRQIELTRLAERVSHKRLILPQLGAVGVSAPQVAEKSGFTVIYGPVRARDIPAWLAAGRKKDEAMRTVCFNLIDRLVLIPVEITNARNIALILLAIATMLAIVRCGGLPGLVPTFAGYAVQFLGALLAGATIVTALLPYLPTKSFSIKGATVGMAWAAVMALIAANHAGNAFWNAFSGGWTVAGALLTSSAIAAYTALNFTGATVFTSQSGTLLETKRALPLIGATAIAGLVLQIIGAL
jgi:hypothetical protein